MIHGGGSSSQTLQSSSAREEEEEDLDDPEQKEESEDEEDEEEETKNLLRRLHVPADRKPSSVSRLLIIVFLVSMAIFALSSPGLTALVNRIQESNHKDPLRASFLGGESGSHQEESMVTNRTRTSPYFLSWHRYEEELLASDLTTEMIQALSLRDLPVLKLGRYPTMQLISHEGNADFSNFLYKLNDTKEFVVLDMEGGPGCVHRAFFFGFPDMRLTLRIDDEVIFHGRDMQLFKKGIEGRFPNPFFTYINYDSGMDFVYPFCFNSSALLSIDFGRPDFTPQEGSDCLVGQAICGVQLYFNIVAERRIVDMNADSTNSQHLQGARAPPLSSSFTSSSSLPSSSSSPSALWLDYLAMPATFQRVRQEKGVITQDFETIIEPGKEWEAFQIEGSGAIRGIVVHVESKDWSKLKWEMAWDDAEEEEPQVDVPFDRFYNSWDVNDSPFTGYQLGASFDEKEKGMVTAYVFYPMPFLKKAIGKVIHMNATAEGAATLQGTLLYKVSDALPSGKRTELSDTLPSGRGTEEDVIIEEEVVEQDYVPGQFGYYHAKWVYKPWKICFNELLNLQDQTGHLLSHSWRLNASLLQWVENDPVVYIDDAQTPHLWHTGLEDEIGGSHGFRFARNEPHPFYGWHLDYVNDYSPKNRLAAYDLGFSDQQYFMKNYIYGIQGHNQRGNASLDYTFHWYAASEPSLWLTDEIDLGSDESMTLHTYQTTPAVGFTELSSAVNGQWYYYVSGWPEALWSPTDFNCPADKEKWMTQRGMILTEEGSEIHFTVVIDPRNEGVLLRRLLDLYVTPQRARVYVDVQYVNVWSYSDHGTEYAPLRFADNTDFFIPPQYTEGKSHLRIKLTLEQRPGSQHNRVDYDVIQGFGWSAFHYSIYSIVPISPSSS